jgi:hypothetical protein
MVAVVYKSLVVVLCCEGDDSNYTCSEIMLVDIKYERYLKLDKTYLT